MSNRLKAMTDRERARQIGLRLATEAHCRYCGIERQDWRLHCRADRKLAAQAIADELLEWMAGGVEWVLRDESSSVREIMDRAAELRAQKFSAEKEKVP